MSAGPTCRPEASHENGPASIAVENRAGIVEPPRQTTPHTVTLHSGQTIPASNGGHSIGSPEGGAA